MSPEAEAVAQSQLQEQLVAWSEMLRSGAMEAVTFAKAQLPGVLQEVILYNRIYYTFMVVLALLLMTVCWTKAYQSFVIVSGPPVKESVFENAMNKLVLSSFVGLFSTLAFFGNLDPFLKVWVAPRMFLLEYVMQLLKWG